MVETSQNLIKQQQKSLIDLIQKKFGMYLTYDIKKLSDKEGKSNQQIDRFFNKAHNFIITWYPALPALFNQTLEKSIQSIE